MYSINAQTKHWDYNTKKNPSRVLFDINVYFNKQNVLFECYHNNSVKYKAIMY